MAKRRVNLGLAGEAARRLIREARIKRRWRLEDVSIALTEVGHPLSKTTLSQIETGGRRVDVDDLVALAIVFDLPPKDLLPKGRTVRTHPGAIAEYEKFKMLPEAEQEAILAEVDEDQRETDQLDAEKFRKVRELLRELT